MTNEEIDKLYQFLVKFSVEYHSYNPPQEIRDVLNILNDTMSSQEEYKKELENETK